MAPTFVGYDVITEKKSSPEYANPDKAITRQLDELERLSLSERDKHLGRDYFRDIKEFYNLEDDIGNFPSYRPRVRIPQLQTLVLNEATDITDTSPKIFISRNGQRDEKREDYFQANWKSGSYNNRLLFGIIWSLLTNLGFIQIGFDPNARRGKGRTWLEARDPETVLPDPHCTGERDWSWVEFWDDHYIDYVRAKWPEKGERIRPKLYASGGADPYALSEGQLEFPEASPLSNQGEQPIKKIFRNNRVRVRQFYLFDETREVIRDLAGTESPALDLIRPRFGYSYPDGRWITECEGVILADGNNWVPTLPDDERGTFPIARIMAMPTISDFWGPPPVKYTRPLQETSERLYAQYIENVVRTNNGVIVFENNCGLDPNAIGWLPGEILMINQGSKEPKVLSPQALPQHMIQLPQNLLQLQKELQGYSQSRQGAPGGGNISPELYDASIWQSQYQTRLRSRMLAETINRIAQIVFYVDATYKNITDKVSVISKQGELTSAEWSPVAHVSEYEPMLEEGSLRVMSASALRSVVAALAKAQMLPNSYVLESLDVPNAKQLAEEKMRELELAAMGKVKRPR